MVIVSATGTALASSTVSAQARTLQNFAVQHMLAAALFSRRVGELERTHAGAPFGPFWEEILHCATASVMTSTASLEAYTNELFFERATVFPGYRSELLDRLWETFEQKSVLEKFEFALLLRGCPPLDRGVRPYQDMAALIALRNALMHFKPEWDDEATRHAKISRHLEGRFSPSPFLTDALIFPRRWATHACTAWAVKSALDFADEFERAAGLGTKYHRTSRTAGLMP